MNQLFTIFRIDTVRTNEIRHMGAAFTRPYTQLVSDEVKIDGEVQFVKQA